MEQAKPKNSYLGPMIIVGTLAILILILITVVGIFLFANQFDSSQSGRLNLFIGSNPLNQIDFDEIDPALALSSLGGMPESDVILEAIDKDRPETALASLLFHPTLTNNETAGGFLQLAMTYGNQDKNKATFSNKMACQVATLAPNMPDTVRADIFLQAGEGLIELDEPSLAKLCLNQAFTIASKSPFLQAAHRRDIFERLQKNYIIFGERELARESLNLSANPPQLTLITEEQTVLPKNEAVPVPQDIQEVEANRWRAAQELAALLVERGGTAPQEVIDTLTEALIAEDQQKLSFYESEITKTTQLSKKIDFILAQIAWMSIKYRVARRGYGITLVPQWEAEAEQIRADLTKAYENLFTLYADLIVALPDVSRIDKAAEERLRSEILAGELGRYPNYPEEQRRKQLLDATEQLKTSQPAIGIFVGVDNIDNQQMYRLIPIE